MIEIKNVSYTDSRTHVPELTDVSMTLGPGLYLLIGDGAGALLQSMATLLRPQSGSVLLDGENVWPRRPSVLDRLAYMDNHTVFPVDTIRQMQTSHAIFYPRFSAEALEENMHSLRLNADTGLQSMDTGERRMAMAAYMLSLNTDLLLLSGVNAELTTDRRLELQALIRRNLTGRQTAVMFTHVPSDMNVDIDGVIIMRNSRLALAARTADIFSSLAFTVTPLKPAEALYTEYRDGAWHAIVRADADIESCEEPDFALLCRALCNVVDMAVGDEIRRVIN